MDGRAKSFVGAGARRFEFERQTAAAADRGGDGEPEPRSGRAGRPSLERPQQPPQAFGRDGRAVVGDHEAVRVEAHKDRSLGIAMLDGVLDQVSREHGEGVGIEIGDGIAFDDEFEPSVEIQVSLGLLR